MTDEVVLRIEPRCEHCPYTIWPASEPPGKKPTHLGTLIEMQAGDDGKPWFLCARCWLDGMMSGGDGQGSGRMVEGDPAPAGSEGDLRCQDSKPKTKKKRSASN